MGSTFNPQILVDKLAMLNNSQASIETLSHWCIFHMNKAKQVVETWNRQFQCSPREQRLAFLYLANDILQNSRRKGAEFVGEFWRVLPGALCDVIDNGDEFGRNAAFRLIAIWEERKVFGSRAQNLKDEFVRRHVENSHCNGKPPQMTLRLSAGNSIDKIVSGYQVIYGGQIDEDVTLSKCRNAISFIEKVDSETAGGSNSGQVHIGSAFVEELHGQHAVLRECIDQLTTIDSSRENLVSHLRAALQDEEFKLDKVRNQIQIARVQSEHATSMCRLLVKSNSVQSMTEQSLKEINPSTAPSSFVGDQHAPAVYAQQGPYTEKPDHIEEDQRKSAAAAVAAKLTASTSSAQMLSYVLSSLASEGVIGNSVKEYSGDCPPEKRTKLGRDPSSYILQNPLPPPYSNLEPIQSNVSATDQQSTKNDPPPPSSSPPPLPPLPPVPQYPMPPYMQTAGSPSSMQYSYSMSQQPLSSMPGYPVAASVNNISQFVQPPVNAYQGFQAEGAYYSQSSSLPVVPISRQ